ncbi:4139_t:CDS:2, partial [Funneliformis geosporum]
NILHTLKHFNFDNITNDINEDDSYDDNINDNINDNSYDQINQMLLQHQHHITVRNNLPNYLDQLIFENDDKLEQTLFDEYTQKEYQKSNNKAANNLKNFIVETENSPIELLTAMRYKRMYT